MSVHRSLAEGVGFISFHTPCGHVPTTSAVTFVNHRHIAQNVYFYFQNGNLYQNGKLRDSGAK